MNDADFTPTDRLRPTAAAGLMVAALAAFHGGYLVPGGWLMLAFPFALFPLIRLSTPRVAFHTGLVLGLGIYAPHLAFFWTIFGAAAVALWLVLAFWIGLFLGIGNSLANRLPAIALGIGLPFLWTGLEYFRSELYYLRFSWLTPALATEPTHLGSAFANLGSYGIGFLLATCASITTTARGLTRLVGPVLLLGLIALVQQTKPTSPDEGVATRTVEFAGAQIEGIAEDAIIPVLDRLRAARPTTELFVLPEYSLGGEPDDALRGWCRTHQRHLIVGGRLRLPEGGFQNTAFVLDPRGVIVFRQGKSVPIQFFDDGIPAASQSVWSSPWGRIGIAICYDLSYTRVIDRLVSLGAEALVVPTMDAASWGAYQHGLHARIAPVRAAEYRIPILRVASSGISQAVDATGRVLASAPFTEEVETISGRLELRGSGTLPRDRWLGPLAVGITGALLVWSLLFPRRRSRPRHDDDSAFENQPSPSPSP